MKRAFSAWLIPGLSVVALLLPAFGHAQTTPAGGIDLAGREYAAAAALQNRQQYELAADEWAQFLKTHPQDPRAARARHYLGLCQLKNQQYAAAAQTFSTLLGSVSKLPARALRVDLEGGAKADLLEPTYLYLGLAQYNAAQAATNPAQQKQLREQAGQAFAILVQKYPQGKYLAQALFYQGEVAYAQGEKQQAAAAYKQVVDRFPQDDLAPDALYALGVTQEEQGQAAAAAATFASFLKSYPQNALAAEVEIRQADALLAQGNAAAAERQFAAVAARPNFKLADYAVMRQAACLYEMKQYAQAAALFDSLPQKFPDSKRRNDAFLEAGKSYYLAGKYPDAIRTLDQARQAGGDKALDAAHWLARSYLANKEPQAASRLLDQLAGSSSGPKALQLELDRADALYDDPQTRRQALDRYAALADKNPASEIAPQARYLAAYAALELHDYDRASREAKAFIKNYSQHQLLPDVMYVEAESQLLQNQYSDAEGLYRQLLSKYPQRSEAELWNVRLGLALYMQRKYREASAALEPVAQSQSKSDAAAEARYLLGASQAGLEKYDTAARWLQASLDTNPQWRQADETLLALAQAYRQLDRVADARAQLDRIFKQYPQSALLDRVYLRAGDYAFAAKDYAAAEADYRHVIEDLPKSPLVGQALYGLGWTQLERGDASAAVGSLDRLMKSGSASTELTPRARYVRARARQQLKEFAPAIEDLQAFLKSKPSKADTSDARYLLGLCQAGLNKPADAAKTFRDLLADDPKYAAADKVLYELAWAQKADGHEADAADSFARLAKNNSSSPLVAESLYHVGEHYYQEQDYKRAAGAFYDSMQKAGKTELGQSATYKLGWAYYRREEYEDARQTFAFLKGTYPNSELNSDAAFMEAESLLKLEKYKEAIAAYAQVKKPKRPELTVLALLHSAQAQEQLEQWPPALELLDAARKADPKEQYSAEILYEQGWAKQNLGRTDEALELYEDVTRRSDGEVAARARFMIGEIYFEKKDHSEAIRNYFKVAYGYAFPEWQAASQYEAGRCFEVLGKIDQARQSYQEVVQKYPQTSKAGQAKQRLAALAK